MTYAGAPLWKGGAPVCWYRGNREPLAPVLSQRRCEIVGLCFGPFRLTGSGFPSTFASVRGPHDSPPQNRNGGRVPFLPGQAGVGGLLLMGVVDQ